jgi:hypothetical protein
VQDLPRSEVAARRDDLGEPVAASGAAAGSSSSLPDMSATETPESPPERLPPPIIDTSDPLQVRAAAVGLHPELSRAVLEKLSSEDFRNAGIAIRSALAQTSDAPLTYPAKRAPEQALFRVHFAAGAPPECRRYIVTVTKDRWASTALPMESCGPARPASPAPPRKE